MVEGQPCPRVCVGLIAGAHGVRGAVKVKSFTADPAAIAGYGPLTDQLGQRRFLLTLLSPAKDHWLARVEGIVDRTAAEALRGQRLYIERTALPEPEEDEFYHADLIGLRAERANGDCLGSVQAIHDFGAGTMVEIRTPAGAGLMVPFTRAAVPVVDLAGGRLQVEPPNVIDGEPPEPGEVAP